MNPISRRTLLAAGTSAGFSLLPAQSGGAPAITVAQVIDRIKTNIGVPWREKTVDNLIAGTPETSVKGIATTMMATLDVLKRSHAVGRNMVITHESTFFSHQDDVSQLAKDETYLYKLNYIKENGMAVFHLHDHWHARRPDGIAMGMARELGWEKNMDPQNPRMFTFPAVPLAKLTREIQDKLKVRTMRVVGDPKLPITNLLASWGNISQFPGIPLIAREGVDALVCGETREWELVEYVQDQIASGKKKALIVIGHVPSEQAGMKLFAEWLKPLVPEAPVEFIAATEPFWNPSNPVG